MSATTPKVRALFEAARADRPTSLDRARIRAALAQKLRTPSSTASNRPWGSIRKGFMIAFAGWLGSAAPSHAPIELHSGLSSAARAWIDASSPSAEAAPRIERTIADAADKPAIGSSLSIDDLEDAPERSPAARTIAPRGAFSGAPEEDSLAAELRALRAAQIAEDPNRSLALLEALGARYPKGILAEERKAAQVLALCAAGRLDEARVLGHRFLETTPDSVQANRIRASCAFAKKTETGSRAEAAIATKTTR